MLLKNGGAKSDFEELLPVMSLHRPTLIGSMSERMSDLLWNYTEHNPNWLLHECDPTKLSKKGMDLSRLQYQPSIADQSWRSLEC